jgi:hypothetical protein
MYVAERASSKFLLLAESIENFCAAEIHPFRLLSRLLSSAVPHGKVVEDVKLPQNNKTSE